MRYRGGGIGHQTMDMFTRKAEEEATCNDGPLPVYNERGERIDTDNKFEDEDEDEDKGKYEGDGMDEERELLEKLELLLEFEEGEEDEEDGSYYNNDSYKDE